MPQLKGKTVTFLVDVHSGHPPENCPFCNAPKTKRKRDHEQHYICGLKLEFQHDRFSGTDSFGQLTEPAGDDGTPRMTMGEVGPEYYGCRKAHLKSKSS